jgi:hypothetical protein
VKSWLSVIAGAIFIIGAVQVAHPAAETRVALIIANSTYQSIPSLRSPVNDAQALDQALTAAGFAVIRLENATKEQMMASFSGLTGQLKPGATSLVYYAGYGISMGGRDYLLPVNAKVTTPASLGSESVDVDGIVGQINRTQASNNIIILDACRANPFAAPTEFTTDMRRRGNGTTVDATLRSISGGLASITAPAGVLIAFPAALGKIAVDSGREQGLYATELIRAISMPGASIETVFKETRLGVIAQSGGTQIPWESSSLTSDISFWPNIASRQHVTPPWVPRSAAVIPKLPRADVMTARVQQVAQQEGIAVPPSLVFDEATTPPEDRSLLGPWGPAVWKSGLQNKVILIFLGINTVGNGHVFYCSSPTPEFKANCAFHIARVINGKIMFASTTSPTLHEYELGDDGNLHGVRAGRHTIVLPPLR